MRQTVFQNAFIEHRICQPNTGADQNKKYFVRTEFAASGVKAARIKVSADNHVKLFLNGKEVAASDEWKEPAEV